MKRGFIAAGLTRERNHRMGKIGKVRIEEKEGEGELVIKGHKDQA